MGFDDFVSVMRSVAETSLSVESRMESGLLSPYENLELSGDSLDSEGLVFEDAKEYISPSLYSFSSRCRRGVFKKRLTL